MMMMMLNWNPETKSIGWFLIPLLSGVTVRKLFITVVQDCLLSAWPKGTESTTLQDITSCETCKFVYSL